ncbi:MAG: hypothetical protein ACRC62_01605 [Microcoleus sp.]
MITGIGRTRYYSLSNARAIGSSDRAGNLVTQQFNILKAAKISFKVS